MIPEDQYIATAVRVPDVNGNGKYVQLKRSGGGTPYAFVRFKISEGPHAGKEIDWNGWLSPKPAPRTMSALQLMGFRSDDLRELASATLDKPVRITVKHEEYQGVFAAKVAFVNAPNDEFDADALDMLATNVKAAMAGGGGGKSKAKAKKEPEPDDDVPW